MALKVKRQRTRWALRHEKRTLQKSEINLGREGTSQAGNFPELRNEIVALKKLEQEQKEVALRIAQIEEGIKKIETDLAQNTSALNETVSRLETEKKPVAQQRAQAKNAADLCERELLAVEKRVEANDAADRELMKKIEALQAQSPPPSDLETQSAGLAARRARLPEEKAELVRARLGSAEACRLAKEKLAAADAELAVVDKNIARVREEFETKNRTLEENIRSQQEAVRDAKEQHQTVEERKNPAYLNIGRHLASQGIAPPNSPQLLTDVQRHRAAVDRHLQHSAELALLSSQIDKQELRKFYFSVASVLALLSIILPLVFKSPPKRDWLPQETDAILSINSDQFERDELPKRWRKDSPDDWPKIWSGLVGPAAKTPGLTLPKDAVRITRALTTEGAAQPREFILVEARGEASHVIDAINRDKNFEKRSINGLAVWERPDLAVSRVGPTTLAVGASNEVSELVRVRLGIDLDLKINGPLMDSFLTLDKDSSLRLITRNPRELDRVFQPVFTKELLEAVRLLGFSLSLQNPAKARLLLKLNSPEAATQFEKSLRDEPQRWLRMEDSDSLLFVQPPEIRREGENIDLRFVVSDANARIILERFAKTSSQTIAVTQ